MAKKEKPRSVIRTRLSGVRVRYSSLEKAAVHLYRFTYFGAAKHDAFWESSDAQGWAGRVFGLTYEDGSEIPVSEIRRVFGSRNENEHASYRGHGPVNGIHKVSGRYRVYRHPKTFAEIRQAAFVDEEAGEVPTRAKRSWNGLPVAWDDSARTDYFQRSWKHSRSTQWK